MPGSKPPKLGMVFTCFLGGREGSGYVIERGKQESENLKSFAVDLVDLSMKSGCNCSVRMIEIKWMWYDIRSKRRTVPSPFP